MRQKETPEFIRLSVENERLRAALTPFARMADQVDEWQKGVGEFTGHFDANDLRRAREVLKQSE